MGCCCLPPGRVKLAVNSKKETNSRVKMGKKSKWAKGQDGLLLFTPWKSQNGLLLFTPDRVKLTVNSKKETNSRVKLANSQDGLLLFTPERVKMGLCCLPPEKVKLAVNSKKETNSRVKMGKESRILLFTPWMSQTNSEQQERNKQQGQNRPRVKMGFCYLPPERVKMGQRSLCAVVVYPLTEWN